LGYGGTKEEMARLLEDAEKLPAAMGRKFDISNFADVVEAIHLVQDEMGIAGATALEAGTTIEGSVNSMKAAWTNLVSGIVYGSEDDIESLIDNFITTIVGDGTESNLGVLGNVLPAVESALSGATKLVENLLPQIVKLIPSLVGKNLPSVVKAGVSIFESLIEGISENQDMLLETAFEVVNILVSGLGGLLPKIIQLGLDLIISLANSIASSLPTLLPSVISIITKVVETLTNPETLLALLTAALAIIEALAEYLLEPKTINTLIDTALSVVRKLADFIGKNIKPLLDAAISVIMALVEYLLAPSNIDKLIAAAIEIIVTIAGALIGAVGELVSAVGRLIAEIIVAFEETDWDRVGSDILAGIKKGIEGAWSNLKNWFSGLFDDLIGIAKKILGIASPSKVFKRIGKWTAEGFGIGFDDEFADVEDDIRNSMDFGDFVVSANGGRYSSSSSGRPINITQNIYAQKKSAAQLMQEARWQAQMGVLSVV
jgi:phage-related protein